jgi:hypothetical protein
MPATPDAYQDLADLLEPYLAGTDTTAIHDDVAGEIAAITAKADPAVDDLLLIEDAADADAKKKITVGSIAGVAGQVSALDAAVPLITDVFAFEDQSDSDAMKRATIQEIVGAAGWVTGLAAKAQPTVSDKIAIEDAADSAAMKESTVQSLFSSVGWITGLAAKATPTGSDKLVIEDAADSATPKEATISSIPIASAQVAKGCREIANDGAVALVTTDNTIIIADSTTGAKAITTVSSHAGQQVVIRLVLCTGNSYTLALVSGTLTFNAAEEGAIIVRNAANDGWLVAMLNGATIV